MKIKIFYHADIAILQKDINKFLSTVREEKILDIKFCGGSNDSDDIAQVYAMVIYKD